MNKKSPAVFCLFLLLSVVSNSLSQAITYNPQMLVEMWRHGARAAARNTFNQDYVVAEGPGNLFGNG